MTLHRHATPIVRRACALAACLTLGLAGPARAGTPSIEFTTAHDSAAERATVVQMQRLLAAHDLSRWTITRKVVVDEDTIPHSDPVLTLHTRHLQDDELLLSTFVHEQMHWHLAAHKDDAFAAEDELRKLYPHIPVGYPEGSNTEEVNYAHLLIVAMEWRADVALMGELKAREVMSFWANDHYTWIYREVLAHPEVVNRVIKAHHLAP